MHNRAWIQQDRIQGKEERKVMPKVITYGDKIRSMTNEELAAVILCPYDTAGEPLNIMPCVKDGMSQELVSPERCHACIVRYLEKKV